MITSNTVNNILSVLGIILCFSAATAATTINANNAQKKLGLLATVSLTSSGHYVASLSIGTPAQTLPLLFDISQPYTWLRCADKSKPNGIVGRSFRRYASSTYGITKHPFMATIFNSSARLAHDVLTLNRTDGFNPGRSDVRFKNQQFYCAVCKVQIPAAAYPSLNVPAPEEKYITYVAGAVGLSNSGKRSLTASLLPSARLPKQFTYCLSGWPDSPTPLFFGASNYTLLPGIVTSLMMGYLPLLKQTKKMVGIYRVAIRGIKVGDKDVGVDPMVFGGGLEVSTKEPYTKLVTPAYVALRDAFRAAEAGIPRVHAVPPFDTCYNACGAAGTRVGVSVDPIDFTLGGNWTAFRFFGRNSMVFLKEDVMCLAFVDGGSPPARNILGSYQQQDSFVEVDLENKRIGFTPLLYWMRTTCANYNFTRGSF